LCEPMDYWPVSFITTGDANIGVSKTAMTCTV
jgi:hypothetical protein